MKPKIFIDGREGTTGLQIDQRLAGRTDVEILPIAEEKRKDPAERARLLNAADIVFLCLPDAAAREAVAMIDNPHTRVIDASTAHRTNPAWAYGFPELSAGHRAAIAASKRVANPGCHATGFISLVYPLVQMGIVAPDAPLTAHSITGYTGAGKKTIAQYEAAERDPELDSPRQYSLGLNHKHIPEMMAVCGLRRAPIFNPIICDFPQGMVVTVPLFLDRLQSLQTVDSLREAYRRFYAGEPFISVQDGTPESGFLGSNNVVGTNELQIFVSGNADQAIVCARFDNLGKGASGAAIQNLNILLGADEHTGL